MKQDQVDQVNKKDMTDEKGVFWDQIMVRFRLFLDEEENQAKGV